MIVERVSHDPKPGHWQELVDLIKAEIERFPPPHAFRLYSRRTGTSAPVVMEHEFESQEESKEYWDAWGADPGMPAFWKKFNELLERVWTSESWDLIE